MNFRETTYKTPVRVVMVVYNDFTNDARVLKEAQTLENTGFLVRIIAFKGADLPINEQLTQGIEVVRLSRSIPIFSGIYKFICFRCLYPLLQRLHRNSAKFAHFLFKIPEYFFIILRTLWQLWRSKPDVIHAHDLNTLLPCWVIAKLRRCPIVYDAHEISTDREGYSQFKWILRPLEAALIGRVDAVITTTDMRAEILQREYQIPLPRVLQNRPRFVELVASKALRTQLNLSERWPIVLYQGGISQGRGMRNLIKVAKLLPGYYFVCIGSGKQAAELDRLIQSEQLTARFFRIPKVHLSELHPLTCSADIGIQPLRNTCLNHYSTDSNKLFEYVMAGLPVAASCFPEIEKIVTTYQIGELFNPDDPENIAASICKIWQPEEYQKLRKNVLAAKEKLTWENQESVLTEEVYGRLSGPGSELKYRAHNNS